MRSSPGVAAVRGDQERCTPLAEQASATATEHGLAAQTSIAAWAVGLLHLGRGRWEAAATRLETVTSPVPGTGHPFVALQALPDLVEAAVRAGRLRSRRRQPPDSPGTPADDAPAWQRALAARCQALITRPAEAREQLLAEALDLHDPDRPFSRARTLLLLGEHLRRERRRVEARAQLRVTTETFERLGATIWEARARAELRATGERVRKREPSTLTQLTPQQLHIVRLVAEGATNKEVAAQLFLSQQSPPAGLSPTGVGNAGGWRVTTLRPSSDS